MGNLSRKQTELLAIGVIHHGSLRTEDAEDVFGSINRAVAELKYLRLNGYIACGNVPGTFRVLKAPKESFRWAENIKNEKALREQKKIAQTDDKTVKTEDDDISVRLSEREKQ